jgi:ABC-type lipoprotein export system ATPase subunit
MRDASEPLVVANNLAKVYPGQTSVSALCGVNFELHRGERVALLGRSGSGKSTLLHLLAGLDQPTSGSLIVDGRRLHASSSGQMAAYRSTVVGIVFQSYNLIPQKTALQNVELPLVFSRESRGLRKQRALAALDAVGLSHRSHHRPAELSGGEQQRVAIARALINRPGLLLADEPTGNLDSATAHGITTLLEEYCRGNRTTALFVTHDEELARRFATRILRIHDGCLREDAT